MPGNRKVAAVDQLVNDPNVDKRASNQQPLINGGASGQQLIRAAQNGSCASIDSLGRHVNESERSVDGSDTSHANETRSPAQTNGDSLPGTLEDIITDSPFLDLDSPMTGYEWFKMVLLFPWVVIKVLLSVSGLILVWAVTRVLVIGAKPNEPGSQWRFALIRPWLKFWTGVFLRLGLGFWGAKVIGMENFREAEQARAICVFNHHSYTDAIVMTHFFATSGVAKASVASIPFIGAIAVALQFLFVQRRGSADARNKHTQLAGRTTEKIAARAADSRFPLLMIAPEATTKAGHVLLRFSTGAFVPGRPIVPILLKYHANYFNAGWGITYTYFHLWRLISQFLNHMEVEVLPVYYPSDEEAANPAVFAANVRKLMAEKLGARLSDHSLEHNFALKKNHVHVNLSGTKIVMATK